MHDYSQFGCKLEVCRRCGRSISNSERELDDREDDGEEEREQGGIGNHVCGIDGDQRREE